MDDPNIYEATLVAHYGDDTLDMATDLIDGEVRFFGVQLPGLDLAGCKLHLRLLAKFEKAPGCGRRLKKGKNRARLAAPASACV